jgi:hypothetical protein
LEPQSVYRSKRLHGEQLAGNEGFTRRQLLERARLPEHEPKQCRSVDVGNHLDARSSSRTDRLSVGFEAGCGRRKVLGFRVARRTSSGASASYGMI